MELHLERTDFTENSTIGTLYINGIKECYILEDKERGLSSYIPETIANKINGKTAIPIGRYRVLITMSNRFQRLLPLLVMVPGFEGIRIHPGNQSKDTKGCLLPGVAKGINFVGGSKKAFNVLFEKLKATQEEIFITVSNDAIV